MDNMEWIEELTGKVRWSKEGALSLKNSLPDVVPVPVEFYLSSIRPYDMANALAYIQEGATHYFAQGYVGIVFYGDSDDAWLSSSSSGSSELSEDESSDCTESNDETSDETSENDSTSTRSSSVETDDDPPLQPGEVGFFVGHKKRAKYNMPEKDFLKVMKTLLKIRREQNHKDIPGQQEFLQYVDKITKEEDDCQLSNVRRQSTEESCNAITLPVDSDNFTGSVDIGDPSEYTLAGLTPENLQRMSLTSLTITKERRTRSYIGMPYLADDDNSTGSVDDRGPLQVAGLTPGNLQSMSERSVTIRKEHRTRVVNAVEDSELEDTIQSTKTRKQEEQIEYCETTTVLITYRKYTYSSRMPTTDMGNVRLKVDNEYTFGIIGRVSFIFNNILTCLKSMAPDKKLPLFLQ